MCLEPLSDDAVGYGHVRHVSIDGEGFVSTPGNADVVEDHVVPVGDGYSVLARIAYHPDNDEPLIDSRRGHVLPFFPIR